MSESGTPIKVTLKASDRNNAPWIVLEAEDPQVLFQYLNGLANGSLDLITEVNAKFQDFWAVQEAARNVQQAGLAAPQDVAQPAVGMDPWGQPQSAPPAFVQPPVQHVPSQPQQQYQQPQVQQAPVQQNFQAKVCPHGQRTRRTGTNQRGPWTAHFCPLPKGDPAQCEPVWND